VVALALSTSLYTEAFSGWLGASLPKSANNSLSAWFNVANGLGFGLAALLFYPVLTRFSGWLGLGLVGLMLLVPLLVLPIMPSPDAGRSGMRESFGRLGTDVWHLLRKPAMLRLMLLFTAPCAAFALTNVFGGIGADFHSSPEWVGFANGPLNMVVGLCVPLLARPILARVEPVVFYLVVGAVGALVTLGLIVLPRTPEVYMLAVVLENIFQMAAFSAEITIKFRSIAPGSPLASTQSALIGSAVTLPLAAMQSFDGQGYGMAGIAGAFGMDAALSLLACAVLVVPVLRWSRRAQLTI
jgi:PAT family beta-lactamase induction signal transducer AmpG